MANRQVVEYRQRRIVIMYHSGMSRKQIAFIIQRPYESVKKVLQKFHLQIPRQRNFPQKLVD